MFTTSTIILISLKYLCLFVLVALVVLWGLLKWSRHASRKYEQKYWTIILSDILDAFPLQKEKREQIRLALNDVLRSGGGQLPAELSTIFRVECLYEPMDDKNKEFSRTLLIYRKDEAEKAKCLTVKRVYSWEWLPPSVQTALFRNDMKRLVFLLFEKKEGQEA